MKNFRLFGEWLVLLGVTVLLVVTAWQQEWTHRIDSNLLDVVSQFRAGDPSDEIVIVEIDDRALSEIGNWPWDRARHADLIAGLAEYDPKLIVVDVLFVDPTNEASDQQLADAIAAAGNVVLAHAFTQEIGATEGWAPIMPIAGLDAAAKEIGHVAVDPDSDGIVRRFALDFEIDGVSYDHLAKVTAVLAKPNDDEPSEFATDPIVPFQKHGAFVSISAVDIVSGQVPREFLNQKIVLIGSTAQGLGDRYAVPDHAGRVMSGVEIQANVLSALLGDRLVTQVDGFIVGGVLFAAIGLLFIAFWQLPPEWSLRVSLVLIASLIALSAVLVLMGKWLPVFPAILGILLAYPVWGWRRLSSVSRFLETEAQGFASRRDADSSQGQSGFDTVAQQVSLMRSLIGETRERLTFLRRTLSASPDPMMVFDDKGRAVLMNERAERIFGTEAEWEGRSLPQLLADNRAETDVEQQEIQTRDGRVFLIASSGGKLDDEGKIVSLRDITILRANEQQRREMLEFLSHDMRSPQAAIVGLVGSSGNALPLQERLDRIENQARRTLKLTDDFVQIARLEYEGIDLEETDLSALLHEALDRAYSLAKGKGITLETDIPDDPIFCVVDPYSLSRAIDNLVGNALKFSPEGKSVGVSLSRSKTDDFVIEVSDQGPGLPPERAKNTFARFGARESGAGPSAGLGLAYVKKVVDEHGGTITAKTAAGNGTSFVISLPADKSTGDGLVTED